MAVTAPVLKYYGSKFRLAPWIISHFPAHRHYVEPFGGGASILMLKQPSPVETYNDLNREIVIFFQVLRDDADELVRRIALTPWSRTEYEICCTPVSDGDRMEIARRLCCRLLMSITGGTIPRLSAFRRYISSSKHLPRLQAENLFEAARRFDNVQIENRDAIKLMTELDADDTLFYLDPPYIGPTRTDANMYTHEMSVVDHWKFLFVIRSLKGKVILSGYPSRLYEQELENRGWRRMDKRAIINKGAARTESLWLSPNINI